MKPSNNNSPMGDPRDTRNLFLAIILSLAVILGWQYFVEGPQKQQQRIAQEAAATAALQGDTAAPVSSVLPEAPGAAAPAAIRPRAEIVAESPRRRITSPALHGSISLTGGRIDDITLARYRETMDPDSPEITLLSPAGIDLPYYAEFGWRGEAGVALPGQNTVWQAQPGEQLTPSSPIVLSWNNGAGLTFEKKIEVDDNYMFSVTQTVRNDTGAPVVLHPYGLIARSIAPDMPTNFMQHEGAVGVYNNKLFEDHYTALAKDAVVSRSTTGGWFGFTDKYWLVALVPDQQSTVDMRALHARQVSDQRYQVDYLGEAITVAPGATQSSTAHLFAGAKEVRVLDAYETKLGIPHFDLAIDFGWFYFLTKPFFYALDLLAGFLGSFGLAILAFTVVVKALLFPLADHAYVSMAKMKKMTPRMTELRSLYANDQQKQSQEMMALYKQEGINPLSGCWPILIQIPIFFSLYKVLFVSIEMRHAPFYGWIRDLSAADPSNVFNLFGLLPPIGAPLGLHIGAWPLAMGITMWLQMKMNPPPTDPAQRIVFGLMPVIFTFSMAGFPVGLVIYWTWSNLLSILQQYVLMRRMKVRAF